MYGVRVAWHELKVAFRVFARGVPSDLISESVAFAQSVYVVRQLFDFLAEQCNVLTSEVGAVLGGELGRVGLTFLFLILLHLRVVCVSDGF